MSDKNYVIQIEENNLNDPKYDESAEEGKSHSRRTSTSSHHSLLSCTSPNYDSGNFSCSNTSDLQALSYSSAEDDIEHNDLGLNFSLSLLSNDVRQLQRELKEKDQALALSAIESRKMKSELERLNKSEKWYKNELKNQKRSKLELLEKLYLNERRFIQENQKLRSEYARICTVCEEIEHRTMKEKDSLVKQLEELQNLFQCTQSAEGKSAGPELINRLKFEVQKQKDIIVEKGNLIEALKKQKQTLLNDLREMSTKRNSKTLLLEARSLTLEDENRKVIKKCVSLVEEKKLLEEELRKTEKLLDEAKSKLHQRELDMETLRQRFQDQLKEINVRNNEIERLTCCITQLENQLRSSETESKTKANVELLDAYKKDVEIKNLEMEKLRAAHRIENGKVAKLQIEILSLESLRENYESAKQEIEHLKSELQRKEFEIQNLKIFQSDQEQKIASLQEGIQEYQRLRENFDKYVKLLQTNNEILESRDNSIEELKLINETKIKEIDELRSELELRQKFLNEKDYIIKLKCEKIEGLKAEYQDQAKKLGKLSMLSNENMQLKENLSNYQNLLEKNNLELSVKQNEVQELKITTDIQSKEINGLTHRIEEISKLREEIDRLDQLLSHKELDIQRLTELNSSQIEKVEDLRKYQKEHNELSQLLKHKDDNLRERGLEIETLKLILKGQKAQIRRFNLKCYENEALREKLEESFKCIKDNQNVLDKEVKELEYLKDVTRRQAVNDKKLLEETEKNFNDETEGLSGEMDAQLRKIEMLKALLDQKSNRIIQLNNEREHWVTLLENLDVEKTISENSSEGNCYNDDLKQDAENQNSGQDRIFLNDVEEVKPRKAVILEQNSLILCNVDNNLNEDSKHKSDSMSTDSFENDSFTKEGSDVRVVILNNDTHELYRELKKTSEEFQNQHEKLESQLKDKNVELNNLHHVVKELNTNLEKHRMEIYNIKEDYANRELMYKEQLSSLEENMEKSLKSLEEQFKLKQAELKKLTEEKCALSKDLSKYKKILEETEFNSLKEYGITLSDCESLSKTSNETDWKTLCKVIEAEHRKKIFRYELHISTLLDNIKSYKKNLEIMENKRRKLRENYELLDEKLKEAEAENEMLKSSYQLHMERVTTEKIREIKEKAAKSLVESSTQYCNMLYKDNRQEKTINVQQLKEITKKYEESQRTVTVLKHQLETARKQFLEMDDYKRLSVELKLNLTNLMDDYKKLLYPPNNYKLQKIDIDAIHDLINRSNNFVPNLQNLYESIDTLRMDIKKVSIYAAGRISPCRKLSLMDELKAADSSHYS